MSFDNALSKRHRYFPSSGRPNVCPTMARKSPTIAVAPWSRKALRNSSSMRFTLRLRSFFLAYLAHFLDQRLSNCCRNGTGAAEESNATNAMLEEGSAAGPGSTEISELGHRPLLTFSEGPDA